MVRYATRLGYEKPYTIPNPGPVPHIGIEENLPWGPIPIQWVEESRKTQHHWSKGLKTWDRLHAHATLTSARRNVFCKRPYAPIHEIDFVLSSTFQPEKEIFAEKQDVYMQIQTKLGDDVNIDIQERIYLNEIYVKPSQRYFFKKIDLGEPIYKTPPKPEEFAWRVFRNRKLIVPLRPFPRDHPIRYGGQIERRNIYNVKLGIPADHTPQTNRGYSRTPSGSYFAI